MPLQSFDENVELLTKQCNPSMLLLLPHSWHLFIVKWILSPCRNVIQSGNVKLLKVFEKNKWFFNEDLTVKRLSALWCFVFVDVLCIVTIVLNMHCVFLFCCIYSCTRK